MKQVFKKYLKMVCWLVISIQIKGQQNFIALRWSRREEERKREREKERKRKKEREREREK